MRTFQRCQLALGLSLAMGAAHAAPVFFEDFESGLSKWASTYVSAATATSGSVVADPKDSTNDVLTFGTLNRGVMSADSFAAGTYTLSFDVLGTCSFTSTNAGRCGAFAGILNGTTQTWLVGDGSFAGAKSNVASTGAWQQVSYTFTSTSAFKLLLQDFNGFTGSKAGDVYFDNVCISTDGKCSATTAGVPEPGSLALAGLALAGLGLARRRRG